MKYFLGVALFGIVATSAPARADFQLTPTLPGDAHTWQSGRAPIILSSPKDRSPARRTAAPLTIPIAHGFGQQVPLAFATRQIVPTGVKISFGPGVDQTTLVSWSGGRPWIDVLRAAVQPLGLHVTVRWTAISITSS